MTPEGGQLCVPVQWDCTAGGKGKHVFQVPFNSDDKQHNPLNCTCRMPHTQSNTKELVWKWFFFGSSFFALFLEVVFSALQNEPHT